MWIGSNSRHQRVAATLAVVPERRAGLRQRALEFINQAVPFGRWPGAGQKGIELDRIINPDIVVTFFNMDDPTSADTPGKGRTARAISLGYDIGEEIRLVRNDSMVPASRRCRRASSLRPRLPQRHEPLRRGAARALLDTYGYLDRDGDGWREHPDGSRSCSRWRASRASSTAASTRCGSAT